MRDAFKRNRDVYSGRTLQSLADEFGVSVNSTRINADLYGVKYLKTPRQEIARHTAQKRFSQQFERLKRWHSLNSEYVDEITISDIARLTKCSEKTVIKFFKSVGVKKKRKRVRGEGGEGWEFKTFYNGELERDDEYFDVVMRNHGFGISLTGEYWKRYRAILSMKLRDGEGNVFHEGAGKGAARNRQPRRIDGGYIF